MNEYYGVPSTPTEDFLMHYGIKGMKWGVRKQIERVGNRRPHSKGYMDAEKKLKRATMAGGLLGGLGYAATHRNEMKSVSSKSSSNHKAVAPGTSDRKMSKRGLRTEALEASRRRDEAYNNLSALGKRGFGKTAKAYREANRASAAATAGTMIP